jgi:uncharacterized membrane protein
LKLLSIIEFIGHFHPLLVHLPIGFLFIALILQWMSRKSKYATLAPAIPIILLIGSWAAFASCITGYLLSISDDYNKSLVSWHMWMGIAVTLVSLMLYAKENNPAFFINKNMLSVSLLLLLFITGHLGGSLTHGSDYLTKPIEGLYKNDSIAGAAVRPIANVQEAVAYAEVITPILQTKCYTCHNANKQKGGLRMDQLDLLLKGGKNGKVIKPGDADGSEMIKRLLLPVDNEHHMPPKEKPQPSESQVALLHWWINNNADAQKKVKDLSQSKKIEPVLMALQNAPIVKKERTDIPNAPVAKADEKIIAQLKARNIVVLPVAQNTNYLMVNFVTDSIVDKTDLQLLTQLQSQLIWLKLYNTNITDEAIPDIARLTNLTKLDLSKTLITDKALSMLAGIPNLEYLNLVNTKVTTAAVIKLKGLNKLQSLYLYKTGYSSKDWPALKAAFSKTMIDTGGYNVPLLAQDTVLVKVAAKKN